MNDFAPELRKLLVAAGCRFHRRGKGDHEGGYNSGRQGWRGVMEARTRLDIRRCRRKGWLVPGSSGLYTWAQDGEPCGSASYTVFAGAPSALLHDLERRG